MSFAVWGDTYVNVPESLIRSANNSQRVTALKTFMNQQKATKRSRILPPTFLPRTMDKVDGGCLLCGRTSRFPTYRLLKFASFLYPKFVI